MFFFNDTATTEIYTLSLHDALPISAVRFSSLQVSGVGWAKTGAMGRRLCPPNAGRSEEHTSELQSQSNLVCRLLLEKKKIKTDTISNSKNAITTSGSDDYGVSRIIP